MRRALAAAGLGLAVLSGCRVPLKVPPIQTGVEAPHIDFARLAEFAKAAGVAYDAPAAIEAAYGKDNVVVRPLPGSDGQYFIYFNHADRTQTVAIRGTGNETNAKADIDSIKIYDPHLKIMLHIGFKRATDELYADLKPFLQKDYKTRLTGHSLGGAMAVILMMDLLADGVPVDQVLTFGQPKVTNEAGGTAYATAPLFRIINDQDIVPQLPPATLVYDFSGPYAHFGPEIVLHPDGTWGYSPVHIPRDVISNWRDISFQDVGDHQIKNYIDRIKAVKP